MTSHIAVLIAAFGCVLPPVHAQTAKTDSATGAAATAERPFQLMVGDKAPSITIAEWIKGSGVKGIEPGRAYIIEFWATWCGPCIAAMPHLSQLQKQYADMGLTVIGVTAPDTRGNSLESARKMVADKGDKMAYTVAWDSERKTTEAWMAAAGRRGIPCSFVVDKNGRVAFIGHPMELDAPLADIVAGKHDIEKLAASYRDKATRDARVAAAESMLEKAMQAEQWDAAVQATENLMQIDPEHVAEYSALKFDVLLSRKKDSAAAYAFGRELLSGVGKDEPRLLNHVAWIIVDPSSEIANRDLPLALALAMRANELTMGQNAGVLDTQARVHFMQGDLEKAVELQTKAAAMDKRLESTLSEYQAALARKSRG